VIIRAIVTSGNASSVGRLTFRVTDSYTSAANDATKANSPHYLVPGAIDTASSATQDVDGAFASTNRNDASGRDAMIIGHHVANRSIGSVIAVDAYNIAAAGTYTVQIYTQTNDGGGASSAASSTVGATWTITVKAVDKTATSASTATLRHYGSGGGTGAGRFGGTLATDSNTTFLADGGATDTNPEGVIWVHQSNGLSTNTAQESFTVTVTGEAYVSVDTLKLRPQAGAANAVKVLTFAVPTADSAVGVSLWSSGTAGTATVSIKTISGTAIGADKTLTFAGDAVKLEVTLQNKKYIQAAATSAVTSVASVKVTDAGGRAVIGSAPAIVSSNALAVSSGSCVDAASTSDASTRDGTYSCELTVNPLSTSGLTATITARVVDPAVTTSTTYLTTTFDVTLGGTVRTITLATDKATYAPGEVMVITATGKDSSGNVPYDGQDFPSTLVANKSLGASISMKAFYDGVSTSSTRSATVPRTITNSQVLFAPAASGAFTISGLDGQTTPAAISVKATVSDDAATAAASAATDAALEAIDAANAATDAANLAAEAADAATVAAEEARDAADAATAAVEALATEVATLMAALKAQITTLANTVAKIAKKVKA
jgi:hypothetical protein